MDKTKENIIEQLERRPDCNLASDRALSKSMSSVILSIQSLMKNKNRQPFQRNMDTLRQEIYKAPTVQTTSSKTPLLLQGVRGKLENSLTQSYYMTSVSLANDLTTLQKTNTDLKRQCDDGD
jgi:hypothetical protein